MKLIFTLAIIGIFSLAIFGQTSPPAPNLVFRGAEEIDTNFGKQIVFRLSVANRLEFPNEMFDPAPDLPPCGRKNQSSRSWVQIYAKTGVRLYGFCALKSADELDTLAFQSLKDKKPKEVYIVIWDRKSGVEYKSNTIQLK